MDPEQLYARRYRARRRGMLLVCALFALVTLLMVIAFFFVLSVWGDFPPSSGWWSSSGRGRGCRCMQIRLLVPELHQDIREDIRVEQNEEEKAVNITMAETSTRILHLFRSGWTVLRTPLYCFIRPMSADLRTAGNAEGYLNRFSVRHSLPYYPCLNRYMLFGF